MADRTDIVIFGTGAFAARILFDLAATARTPVAIAIAGRDSDRLAWLRTAAAARAAMFGCPVSISEHRLPTLSTESTGDLLTRLRPVVVVNTASVQGGRKVSQRPDRWADLVRTAGLGITAVLQARISLDIARAVVESGAGAHFVNCCYPDVVNPMIAAAGLPIASGIGNVAILAHAFAGLLAPGRVTLHLLAQHAALSAFRLPGDQRHGVAPLRLWLDGREVDDVFARFKAVKLAPEPVIDVSGASGVPLFLAMVAKAPWAGHVPGPNGLPGGYPVRFDGNVLALALPDSITEHEAIAWNEAFEQAHGVVVKSGGRVWYTGRVEDALRTVSPTLAAGFAMSDFAQAFEDLYHLRNNLGATD